MSAPQEKLFRAVWAGDVNSISDSIKSGASLYALDEAGYTICSAAVYGGSEALEVVIDGGADVNQVNEDETTALTVAATIPDAESIRILLRAGARPRYEERYGDTSLHIALECGFVDIALDIIGTCEHDDLEIKNHLGRTPLMIAAAKGDARSIRELLERGANPLARSSDTGETPLHFAAQSGTLEASDALLNGGADRGAKDNWGQTPAFFAQRRGGLEGEAIFRAISS